MPDLFISYAREDQEFVRELVAELTTRGKDSWADWEDILPTAEWWNEIQGGIETSNAFVFVLTPDSVTSDVCRQELEHAVSVNKRIVPLLRREVEEGSPPEALAVVNWIAFSEGTPIAAGTDSLVAALGLDLDWLHGHTRWLVAALEWERSGRDASLLARRRTLAAAEEWLSVAALESKDPPPTPLHREYIRASRRAATRRQRAGGAVALATVLALSLLAATAILQRDTAVTQRRLAVSRGLLEAASGDAGKRIDLAALLTIESFRRSHRVDARSALAALVQRAGHLQRVLSGFSATPRRVALAGTVVVGTDDGALVTANRDGSSRRRVPLPDSRSAPALSSDGSLAAVRTQAGIELWRRAGPSRLGTIALPSASRTSDPDQPVLIERSGRRGSLLVVMRNGRIALWPGRGGRKPEERRVSPFVTAADAPPGAGVVAAVGSVGLVTVPVAPGSSRLGRVQQYDDPEPQRDVAVAPRGNVAAAVSVRGDVVLWDLKLHRRIKKLPVRAAATSVAFSQDGLRLAVGDVEGEVTLWTLAERDPVATLDGQSDAILDLAFRGGALASASLDGTVDLWTPEQVTFARTLADTTDPLRHVDFSHDGEWLAASGVGAAVPIWQLRPRTRRAGDAGESHGATLFERRVATIAFGPSTRLATATVSEGAGGRVALVALPASKQRQFVGRAASPVLAYAKKAEVLAWNPHGRQVTVRGVDGTPRPLLLRAAPVDLALDDGGGRLAAATARGIELLDTAPGASVGEPAAIAGTAVAFLPDGRTLLAATAARVLVWDIARGRARGAIPLPGARDVAVTPDGAVAAVVGNTGRITLWDLRSSSRLGDPFDNGVYAVAFSPDGRRLAAVGASARLWDSVLWSDEAARAFLCRSAGPSLSPHDWEEFVGVERYRRTCE